MRLSPRSPLSAHLRAIHCGPCRALDCMQEDNQELRQNLRGMPALEMQGSRV
jgi:hypothetical protein